MKFEFTSIFNFNNQIIETASYDDKLFDFLEKNMPSAKKIQLLEIKREEKEIKRKVKYLPHPIIKHIGPKRISPEAMEWIEESIYNINNKELKYKNIPTHPKLKSKVHNSGTIKLKEKDGKSYRTITGEIKVSIPFIGRIAEKIVINTAKKLLKEEETAFNQFLNKYYTSN